MTNEEKELLVRIAKAVGFYLQRNDGDGKEDARKQMAYAYDDWAQKCGERPKKIFSGESAMWDEINNAKTTVDLRDALYHLCCKIQELEDKFDTA